MFRLFSTVILLAGLSFPALSATGAEVSACAVTGQSTLDFYELEVLLQKGATLRARTSNTSLDFYALQSLAKSADEGSGHLILCADDDTLDFYALSALLDEDGIEVIILQ